MSSLNTSLTDHPESQHASPLASSALRLGHEEPQDIRRISWSAIFAGVLVAIIVQVTLSLLGLGIGLSTIDPLTEASPMAGLGTGAAIWYIVSSLIGLAAGGWVSGRLSAATRSFDNMLAGILAWSLTTMLTIYLLTTAIGGIIGGASRFVGAAMKTVGGGLMAGANAAGPQIGDALKAEAKDHGINVGNLKSEFTTLLRQTGKPGLQPGALNAQLDGATADAKATAGTAASNPQDAGESTDALFDRFFSTAEGTAQQVDRDALANVVMARTGKSQAEAYQVVDDWTASYNKAKANFQQAKAQAEQKAREIGDQAAAASSRAAIFAFFGLVLGLCVSAFAGRMGGNSRERASAMDRPVHAVA